MAAALKHWGGYRPKDQGEGDSVFAVFETARAALGFAVEVQRQMAQVDWADEAVIRVRRALHTGEPKLVGQNYKGGPVHRCARLRTLAHGGQTLLSESTALLLSGVLPRGISFADLVTHGLRGLQKPEHVFQLNIDGLDISFPALRSSTRPQARHNLTQWASTFVGRECERRETVSLLCHSRLLTVVGPGGTGKTRLAVHVASALVDSQADGAWLVELAPVSPELVVGTIANVLKVATHPDRTVVEALVDGLRPKPLLLLLDNCEHVIDETAHIVDRLLQCCPRVTVLVTSREPLSISDEHVYRLTPLSVPRPEARLPVQLLASDSVALFVQRAVSQRRSFTLDETNATAVARICRRLDGIPLAIELAAARVRALPAAEIDRRLG